MAEVNPGETALIAAALEKVPMTPTFLLNTFASETILADAEKITMDFYQGSQRVAPLVHPENPAQFGAREPIREDVIKPGYLKPGRKIKPADLNKRLPGENALAPMARTQRLQRLRTRDFADMRDENVRWEEWIMAQQLTSGAIAVSGYGMDVAVTLPLLASHNIAAGSLVGGAWNTATANGLLDIEEAGFLVNRDGELPVDFALFGKRAWRDYIGQPEVRALMDLRFVDPRGTILLGGTQVGAKNHGGSGGVNYWTYDAFYKDIKGVIQAMVPDDVCIVASTQMRVVRPYGQISSLSQLTPATQYLREWTENNPEVFYSSLESAPLPFAQEVNGFVILNTR